MERAAIVAVMLRALVVGSCAMTAGAPVAIAQQATSEAAAALGGSLASVALRADAAATTSKFGPEDRQKSIEAALEQAIATSGVAPEVALQALLVAENNLQSAGKLSPAIAAAIAAVRSQIRATLALDAPGSLGDRGTAPFGSAPPTGGGGSSDYRVST